MKTFRNGARVCVAFLALATCVAAAAQTAPPPLPQPQLSALPADEQAALRKLRAEFDRVVGKARGEERALLFLQMGAVYLRAGMTEAGNIALDHAVAAQPGDPRLSYLRGLVAVRQGQSAVAATSLARAIKLDPNYLPAHYHLAEVQIAQDKLKDARATLAPLVARRKDLVPARALLGEIALRERRFDEAIAQFNAALELEPAANALYERLAEAHAGRGDAAAEARARAAAGTVVPRIIDPLALELEDPQTRAAGIAAMTRTTLEQRVTASPRDLATRLALIEHLALAGDLSGARIQLQTAKAQAPGNANVLVAQAIVAEAGGDDAAARNALERATTLEPAHAGMQRRYADALMRAGQPDAAYRHYLAAAGKSGDTEVLASAVAAASLANRCGAILPLLRSTSEQRRSDGPLAQIEVRAIASCPAASAAQKALALRTAKALYKQNPGGEHAEILAMALAAHGQGREAVEFEAQAIFDATKRGDRPILAGRRAWLKQFERGQPVSRPWPQGNLLFAPPPQRAAR